MDGRTTLRKEPPGPVPAIEYPTRDGRPMGETDQHRDEMKDYALNVLRHHFRDTEDVYVSGNNFIYYAEGSPEDCVSPDCYVVKGVPKHLRDTYKVWEERSRTPCFVLEITSKSTRREDRITKKGTYQDELGVPEYFLFDPRKEWIGERLQGFRLEKGSYRSVEPTRAGRLRSRELGLELAVDAGGHLRFFRPGASEPLPTSDERAAQAEKRIESERDRAERSEAELKRLRAELERLRNAGAKARSLPATRKARNRSRPK